MCDSAQSCNFRCPQHNRPMTLDVDQLRALSALLGVIDYDGRTMQLLNQLPWDLRPHSGDRPFLDRDDDEEYR